MNKTNLSARWRLNLTAAAVGAALVALAPLAQAQQWGNQPQQDPNASQWNGQGWNTVQPAPAPGQYQGQYQGPGPQGQSQQYQQWRSQGQPGQWHDWRTDNPNVGQPPGPRSAPADQDWQNQPTPPRAGEDPHWAEHQRWEHERMMREQEMRNGGYSDDSMTDDHRGEAGRWARWGLHPQWQNGVEFVSGGVALDESRALKAEQGQWPLSLMFTGPGGEYLADVHVTISRGDGDDVIKTSTHGPFLLAKLQPGRYKVYASYEGHSSTKWVRVGGPGSARASFYFPADTN